MGEIFERAVPREALEWTGERLTTATAGQVEIEHLHRYFLARALCRGLDVLDVASGEGYGSALLAQVARSVVGIELSAQAVAHAARAYAAPNLRYQEGDARSLPLEDASVDAVVSFETLEHFFEHERFVAEVRRVLRPGGRLFLSSPERDVYSPPGSPANPYHAHELSRADFEALLRRAFSHVHVLLQRPMLGSALVADDGAGESRILTFERRGNNHFEASGGLPRPTYIIAVASDQPLPAVPTSLFIDTSEIGDVLSGAAEAGARQELQHELEEQLARANKSASGLEVGRTELVRRAEEAEAGLVEARAEIQRREEEVAALAKNLDEAIQAEHEREELQAELEQARAELQRRAEEVAALAKNLDEAIQAGHEREELQAELEQARAELLTARHQRDNIRMSFHQRSTVLAELRGKVVALEAERDTVRMSLNARSTVLAERVVALEAEAAEGEARYRGLRARLEAILRRFWVLRIARLVPQPIRHWVRERMLGGARPT